MLTPSKKKRKVERPVVLSSKLSKDHRSITTCILLLDRFIINLVSSSAQYILGLATHRHRERETSPSNGGCPRFHARVGPRASGVSPLHAPTARTHAEGKKESVSSAVHLSTVSTRNRAVFVRNLFASTTSELVGPATN